MIVALLRGSVPLELLLERIGNVPVRLSPVVASELLRGASGRARRSVERLIAQLLPIEPPSWRRCWIETGKLLPHLFPDHEGIGLSRSQSDALLALTARDTGAVLLAGDRHFAAIRRRVPFRLVTVS